LLNESRAFGLRSFEKKIKGIEEDKTKWEPKNELSGGRGYTAKLIEINSVKTRFS
jgi:hypothetical protein